MALWLWWTFSNHDNHKLSLAFISQPLPLITKHHQLLPSMINKHQPPLASFKSSWTFVSQLQPSSNVIGQHRESWSCHQPSSTINNHLRIFFTHHHQPASAIIIALQPACTVINHQASLTVSIIDHHHHKPSSASPAPTSPTSCWAASTIILEQHQPLNQLLTPLV